MTVDGLLWRADTSYVWQDDGAPCSGCVVADSTGLGQCLLATHTIPPGMVVLREAPSHVLSGEAPASMTKAVHAAVAGTHALALADMIASVLHMSLEMNGEARARIVRDFFHVPDAPELADTMLRVVKRVQQRSRQHLGQNKTARRRSGRAVES